MAQTNLNIRIDEDLKNQFDALCQNIGMSKTTAICIFAKKAITEQRIPFDVTANDPFYSPSNIRHLENIAKRIADGTANLTEHELIEADE